MKWLAPRSALPEMAWADFLRLMRDEFSVYALPNVKRPGVRLVESPFDPKTGKSIYVIPDNRADIISPKNLVAVLNRFEILDSFIDKYNHFFQLSPPEQLDFSPKAAADP